MTKAALTGTSLVAAVPGGFLAYVMVRAFLDHADKMATMLQVVTGTTLLFAVLMALCPFAILLFVRSPAPDEAAAKPTPQASPSAANIVAPVAAGGMSADETADETADEFPASGDEFELADEADGFEAEDELEDLGSESLDDSDSESFSFDDDAFEFEDEDEK